MAYTNQNIIDAYDQAIAGGASEAQFVERAQSMGISNDQLASARSQLMGGATSSPAPAPAPTNVVSAVTAPAAAPSYDQSTINTIYEQQRRRGEDNAGIWNAGKSTYNLSDEQLRTAEGAYNTKMQSAQQWANGKTWGEIANKASEIGLHANEVGAMFGKFGGSGQQVQNLTGYGTGGDFNAGGTPNDWKFDVVNGWTKVQTKRPGGGGASGGGGDMPTTGINLSQVQTATPWEVAKNQTVANQLEQIIAADSPLMQQARMRALQAANQRGLLNSSMAVSAGESALYDAAMPIAQQDAATYADAGRFNADAQNTFSRDNNAFVRDAFMADFNLAANEWAKKQDQVRELEKMDYTQRLTLERDAIQNGYTNARDAILNGYTIARDNNTNAFTLQRDAAQNTFTAGENDKDRTAAANRTAMGIQAPQQDTSVIRQQMSIDSSNRGGAREIISNSRSNLTTQLNRIEETPGLSTDQKNAMASNVVDGYNTIVLAHISDAGWTADQWLFKPSPTPTPAPAPAASTNVVQNVTQGGDGG